MTTQSHGRPAVSRITAFLDGPDSLDIPNVIHSTEGARAFGYRAALVRGVTVYAWAVPCIVEALGERWLDHGWAQVAFRRPVYPGDEMTVQVTPSDDGAAGFVMSNGDGERCLVGTVGLDAAPWLHELQQPDNRTAVPSRDAKPRFSPDTAPLGYDLPPMAIPFSPQDAAAYATERAADEGPLWRGDAARLHPSWIAARGTHLVRHSFEYGPGIHAETRVQHLAPAHAGQTLTVAGRLVDYFERKGHRYSVLDCVLIAEDGRDLARFRHTIVYEVAKRA